MRMISLSRSARRRDRDESGVVAVLVAITALVLFGVAALGVDLSHAYWQKREIQKRADFSALAGAAGDDLPMTATGATCTFNSFSWKAPKDTDQAVVDAAAYLNTYADYAPSGTDVRPADLVDCNLANGEAGYGTWNTSTQGITGFTANQNQLSIISQPRTVNFGFATVLGFTSVDVSGQATAEIKTKLLDTLPMYAYAGCDYGQQTIAQPTNGHSSDGVNLAIPNDKNTFITEEYPLSLSPASSTTPPTVQLNSDATTVTITGTNLDKVTTVGFFRSAPSNPPPPTQVTSGLTVANGGTSLTVTIPATVTSVQDTWFIRLLGTNKSNNGSPEWTPVTQNGNSNKQTNLAALPFTVGNATLQCTQGSSEGNFGTLDLFNRSSGAPSGQSDNIAYNIAAGLQYGLAPYPTASLSADGTCTATQQGAVLWPTNANTGGDGTNCVGTKTGLDSQAATEGFITGVGGEHGLLATTDGQCANDYPNGASHMIASPAGPSINNDVLSCFFSNDSVTVGDVSSAGYGGPDVIDQSIYDSPRFVLIPILYALPTSGSSTLYEVKDFRPAFITDESSAATRVTGAPSAANGLIWNTSNGNPQLSAVNVVFINPNALPNPPLDSEGKYIPYTGTGQKSVLLVN